MDFHDMRFPDATFDVATSIESICHSTPKDRVLREAWRVLKPGGRLVIADAYFARDRESLTSDERAVAKQCFEGVHIPPLPSRDEFEHYLSDARFSRIIWQDKANSILPTAVRVNRLGRVLLPISRLFGWLHIRQLQTSHMRAFVSQYDAFRRKIGVYGIFAAVKPVAVSPGWTVKPRRGRELTSSIPTSRRTALGPKAG
jgi:tocopherol O-methyltransferase